MASAANMAAQGRLHEAPCGDAPAGAPRHWRRPGRVELEVLDEVAPAEAEPVRAPPAAPLLGCRREPESAEALEAGASTDAELIRPSPQRSAGARARGRAEAACWRRPAVAVAAASALLVLAGLVLSRWRLQSGAQVRSSSSGRWAPASKDVAEFTTPHVSEVSFSPIQYGAGCTNWQDIQIGDSTTEAGLAACAQRCHQDGGCKGFNFQPKACDGKEQLSPGACVIYNDYCKRHDNECWDLYLLDIIQSGTDVVIDTVPVEDDAAQDDAAEDDASEDVPARRVVSLELECRGIPCHELQSDAQLKASVIAAAKRAELEAIKREYPGPPYSELTEDDVEVFVSCAEQAGFDCEAGYANRAAGWSAEKKQFCEALERRLEQVVDGGQRAFAAADGTVVILAITINMGTSASDEDVGKLENYVESSDDPVAELQKELRRDSYVRGAAVEQITVAPLSDGGAPSETPSPEPTSEPGDNETDNESDNQTAETTAEPTPEPTLLPTPLTTEAPAPTPDEGAQGDVASVGSKGDPSAPFSTFLLQAATPGQKEVYVDDQSGIAEGDTITFTSESASETHEVVGVGSVMLDKGVQHTYPAGTIVLREKRPSSEGGGFWSWFGWLLFVIFLGALAGAVYYLYRHGYLDDLPDRCRDLAHEAKERLSQVFPFLREEAGPTTRPEMIKAVFHKFDRDRDHRLSSEELMLLASSLQHYAFEGSPEEWEHEHGRNIIGDGHGVDLKRFQQLVNTEQHEKEPSRPKWYQTDEELHYLVQTHVSSGAHRQQWVRYIFHTFDEDTDGVLNKDELFHFYERIPGTHRRRPTADDWSDLYEKHFRSHGIVVDLGEFRRLVDDEVEDKLFHLSDKDLEEIAVMLHGATSESESEAEAVDERKHMLADLFRALTQGCEGMTREDLLVLARHEAMRSDNWTKDWDSICPRGAHDINLERFSGLIGDPADGGRCWFRLSDEALRWLPGVLEVARAREHIVVKFPSVSRSHEQRIGLVLRPNKPTAETRELQVLAILADSLCGDYNAGQAQEHQRIQRGDHIVMVNGVLGHALELKRQIEEATSLEIVFARDPVFVSATADKEGICHVCEERIERYEAVAVGVRPGAGDARDHEESFWVCGGCLKNDRVPLTTKQLAKARPQDKMRYYDEKARLVVRVLRADNLPEIPEKSKGLCAGGTSKLPITFVEVEVTLKDKKEANWKRLTVDTEAKLWTYTPVNGLPIHPRETPEIEGNRTKKPLRPGDTFSVTEEKKVGEVTFLRLAGGEGWLFDKNPNLGVMCTKAKEQKSKKKKNKEDLPQNRTAEVEGVSPEFREEFELARPDFDERGHLYMGCGPIRFVVKTPGKKGPVTLGSCELLAENLAPLGKIPPQVLPLELAEGFKDPHSRARLQVSVTAEWIAGESPYE